MKIHNYTIPPECKHVSVEASGSQVIITFEPEHPSDFLCKETDHIEELPRAGQLAILWNSSQNRNAIISTVLDEDYYNDKLKYKASSEVWYERAIRFRCEEQYLKIINHVE